ncbi:MAG TPA: ATP-binding protein [Solirubrobacteraceae bacterium]|nr:ATP-binding protein [Solirubrobacteraceae bacterium]
MNSRVRAIYKIDPQLAAPAQARRIIAEELSSRLSDRLLNDVKLMVSELVADGVVHGSLRDSGPVMLDLAVNHDIRCRVLNDGPGFARRVEQAGRHASGLRVVEQLSDRWGMQSSSHRTEVWFERHCA